MEEGNDLTWKESSQVAYNFTTENNTTLTCKLCFSTTDEKTYFVSVNLLIAFVSQSI